MSVPAPDTQSTANGGSAPFLDIIRSDLDKVERALLAASVSEVHQVDALGQHVLLAGGKRLRPAAVILSARALRTEIDTDRLIAVAAAMELVHTATLVHDDVVDNTSIRRGKATANAVFGNGVAVISGDFLLARAVRLLAREGEVKLIRTVSEVTVDLSEGEVQEMIATGEPNLPEEQYLNIIQKKTASFIEGCCRCGAITSGATESEIESVGRFGYHVGMAFQLIDDLLDYVGDPALTGKPIGTDLREGRPTLPFLLGVRRARDGKLERLLSAFGNPALRDGGVAVVVRVLDGAGALESVRRTAREHVDAAREALTAVTESPYKRAMLDLSEYVLERDR